MFALLIKPIVVSLLFNVASLYLSDRDKGYIYEDDNFFPAPEFKVPMEDNLDPYIPSDDEVIF